MALALVLHQGKWPHGYTGLSVRRVTEAVNSVASVAVRNDYFPLQDHGVCYAQANRIFNNLLTNHRLKSDHDGENGRGGVNISDNGGGSGGGGTLSGR